MTKSKKKVIINNAGLTSQLSVQKSFFEDLPSYVEKFITSKKAPLILMAVFFINCLFTALSNSATCDELGAHIPSGVLYWETGKFSGGIDNPPAGQLIITSLVKLFGLKYTLFSEQFIFLFRLPVMVMGLLLAFFLYRFVSQMFGKTEAFIALFFYSLSPNIIAHSTLASLDLPIAFFIFITVYFTYRFIEKPGLKPFIFMTISLSLALTTKIQSVLLIPLVCMTFVFYYKEIFSPGGLKPVSLFLCSLIMILIPLFMINLVYLNFPFMNGSGILPADFITAVLQKYKHSTGGHFSYLMGEYSLNGWWYYFPVAVIFKTPPAVLLFALTALISKPSKRTVFFIYIPLALFFAAAVKSHINIGLRHLLMIYPFIFMLAALGVRRILSIDTGTSKNKKELLPESLIYRLAVILLMLSVFVQAAMMTPHQLSYFNILAGGSANGHRILLDSNYDWGQNDYYLERYIKEKKINYKIDPDPFVPVSGNIIVNANALFGILNRGPAAYLWLRQYRPVNRIAYTWFEYYVPEQDIPKLQRFRQDEKQPEQKYTIAEILEFRKKYSNVPDINVHLQLALLLKDAGDYSGSFNQIRYVLNLDPVNKTALSFGGELIVRLKLGTLKFRDDDYIKFFRTNKTGSAGNQ